MYSKKEIDRKIENDTLDDTFILRKKSGLKLNNN